MAWNEQVDANADIGSSPVLGAPDTAPGFNGLPMSSIGMMGRNAGEAQPVVPLQNIQGEAQMSKEYVPGMGPVNPLIQQGMQQPQAVSQPAVVLASGPGSGVPAGALAPASVPAVSTQADDDTGADDLVWVNRAKRIIAGTRGDPHRQVQLLQQLSVVYLKERYGRSVHADEV